MRRSGRRTPGQARGRSCAVDVHELVSASIQRNYTYPVRGEALPKVLDLLLGVVGGEDVDDAEVVDQIHVVVLLVGRAEAALVLVEEEVLALDGRVLFREAQRRAAETLGVRLAHDATHRDGVGGAGTLDLGRLAADGRHVRLRRR